ncbi:MAG TPA: hypothetical protein VG722_11460 [Tepidisphaeraceae bacterium]|nr:hypothetical protein [Tepidisphaeraceae bacterium]
MRKLFGVAIFCQLFCLVGLASADNLVPNGSFEGGSFLYTDHAGTDDTVPNGWYFSGTTPFSGASNFQTLCGTNGALAPEDGSCYVAFQSAETNGTQDCLFVDIQTTPGQSYNFSFWVAVTAPPTSNTTLIPVWDVNGTNTVDLSQPFYSSPNNVAATGYQQFTFTEVASETTTTLGFHGTDGSGAILLDNVSVTAYQSSATPEPSSFLLSAFGVLAGVLLLKRRTSSIRLR